ncbi:MAG: homoserine dehydrogenase [Phycisphaerales bacterium]|nr:homoserine dehydrogenase [Phycisphaerales bacterium]
MIAAPSTLPPRRLRVALLGCGTVGREVARRLLAPSAALRRWAPHGIELVAVLVRDLARDRDVPREVLVGTPASALGRAPDVAVEVLGGREDARRAVQSMLEAGVPVASANKTLIAHDGDRLHDAAVRGGTGLRYEAAVGAAVPVLAALAQRRGDRIVSIRGVLNGTCNAVLTSIERDGCSLASAIEQARRAGLCEPDPRADLSGADSMEKLCVLARAAGLPAPSPGDLPAGATTGIEGVAPEWVRSARRAGGAIRLVAELSVDMAAGRVHLRVAPRRLSAGDPLAAATGPENIVVIDSDPGGTLVLRGQGAGPGPTASAILGDLAALVVPQRSGVAVAM